jgi:hypothetical protein
MDPDLTGLAASAAKTLVASMTADSWEQVKTAFVRLWQRGHPGQAGAISAELDMARSDSAAARAAGDEHAEADILGEWRSRLGRLIRENEELQAELRRLVEEYRLPDEPGGTSQVVLEATVHGSGRVNQAGHDQTVIGA